MSAVSTPGPWTICPYGLKTQIEFKGTSEHTPTSICTVWPEDEHGEAVRVAQANARLIAAAPDMVVTLQKAALSLDDMEAANAMLGRDLMAATCLIISNEIRNVLAKARGTEARFEGYDAEGLAIYSNVVI
jgi:hypothetical protein